MSIPRVVVSGLSGGVGKTVVSLGLIRAFVRRNLVVHPCKKGPDYTDTAWLALAAKGKSSTLDPFFLESEALRGHFLRRSHGADLAVIEGNRGFFDGRDIAGSVSTAELARHLEAPVVLVVSIAKMTRTVAAVVSGCKNFPGGERIGGVILNRCGGPRHEAITRRAVEELTGIPVFGVLPRRKHAALAEHRAGLVAAALHTEADAALDALAGMICDCVDIDAVLDLARNISALPRCADPCPPLPSTTVRIGVARDAALWQYYDENLEALREAGAEIVFVSLLDGKPWPELDGLYLGGGDLAPHAHALARDAARKGELKALIDSGMPVYAEHSGYFYLGEEFICGGVRHAMAGVFPFSAEVTEKPARLGYVEASLAGPSPVYPPGFAFKGHEYHYADIRVSNSAARGVLHKTAGGARIEEPDGLVRNAAFGTSMQVFAPAVPEWAPGMAAAAAAWKRARRG